MTVHEQSLHCDVFSIWDIRLPFRVKVSCCAYPTLIPPAKIPVACFNTVSNVCEYDSDTA